MWAEGVRRSPAVARSAEILDAFFDGEPSIITSGLRTPSDQLLIILDKVKRHSIQDEFPEITNYPDLNTDRRVEVDGKLFFWWQRSWSRLLSLGDIVNPPVPAEVLFDYFRPGSQDNKKGQIVGISPHQRGLAYDIGGGTNLMEKAKRIMRAKQEGTCFLTSFLVERVNNAIHCDCQQIG